MENRMKTANKTKKAIAYCRLSKEDGDDVVSGSIINQKKLIENYAKDNGFMITEYYIDDGVSGYTMDRPDFNRLKHDLNMDKVHTIIAKDLSRIGRHSAKTQLFLENIYEDGKRVIALGDNYDTYDEQSRDIAGIQTWANEKYIRDTSKKIRRSIQTKQKEGNYANNIPYGYIKDDFARNKYSVDQIASKYVKDIFNMYIDGMGYGRIARTLTENKVPTYSMLMKQHKDSIGIQSRMNVVDKWDKRTIERMLKNPFYTGTLVLGKTRKRSINGKPVEVPEEERFVFENAHEAIIDKRTFNLVQKLIEERSVGNWRGKKIQTRQNLFSGILYCSDCGLKMTTAGKQNDARYICKTYNAYGTKFCSSHAVNESEILECLIEFLSYCVKNIDHIIEDIDKIIAAERNKKGSTNTLKSLNDSLEKAKKSLSQLIENKLKETISNPEMADIISKTYEEIQMNKYKEIQSIEKQIKDMECDVIDDEKIRSGAINAYNLINDFINSKNITKAQILTIVEKIIIHEDTSIDIFLKSDLDKLCNGYFNVSENGINRIKKLTYEYITKNKNKFSTNDVIRYIRENKCSVTYKTVSNIINKDLIDNCLIEKIGYKSGYRMTCTEEELKSILFINNVGDMFRRICANYDMYELLCRIYEFGSCNTYKDKKMLF